MSDSRILSLIEKTIGSLPRGEFNALDHQILRGHAVDSESRVTLLNLANLVPARLERLWPLIRGLTHLRRLSLYDCKLHELPSEVTDLHSLTKLVLNSNRLKALPPSMVKLSSLEALYLHDNQFDEFPLILTELPNLSNLQFGGHSLRHLPPEIGRMRALRQLNLSYGELEELPAELAAIETLQDCNVDKNPIVRPPREIANQGIQAIRHYFSQVATEHGRTRRLLESKLLIIGDGGTGKTTFRRKLIDADAPMPRDQDTTLGVEVDNWHFRAEFEGTEQNFNVNIWDFGGQRIYRGTHQIFFSDKSLYVLVADTREQGTDFSYWLNTVQQLAGAQSAVVIVLNKKYGHEIKFDEQGFRGHFGGLITEIAELDLSEDRGAVRDLQDLAKRQVKRLPEIGHPLPPSWVRIREDLLEESAFHISFDRFREICRSHRVTDTSVIHTLSRYFSRVGAITHYIDDPVLQDRVYLDSNWLVNTVYEVLDNDRVKSKKGRIDNQDIDEIWKADYLFFEKEKLIQLMHKFGLMYRIPQGMGYVIPEHLPSTQPYAEWEHTESADLLHFVYEFDKFMPAGLMSRLIVSLYRYIQDHHRVWHRGVNLELHGTFAEVIESYGSTNTFNIRIAGTNKIELLSIIRERFAGVLEPYQNLHFKQLVPCHCEECLQAALPRFHEYRTLLNLRTRGVGAQCPASGELVSVNELLRITEARTGDDRESLIEEPTAPAGVSTIEVFLASSAELESDRQAVEIWLNRENKKLIRKGAFLHLNLWEDFLDAMSTHRLQDEYNKAVAQSEIVICLFGTRVGKYTEEEFDVAYNAFKATGKPKYIFTYFRETQISSSDRNGLDDLIRLHEFKSKLDKLGHFYTPYKSSEDLSRQLTNQLEKILLEQP